MKQLVLFPGGFKPPHIGHMKLIKDIIKLYPNAYIDIIIGKTPRLLVPPFDKKPYQLTKKEKEDIIKNYSKCNDNSMDKECIPQITAEQSKEIWEEFNLKGNVKIMISPMNSPIFFAYTLGKSLKKGDELILIKSEKNHQDARFELFDKLKKNGVKIKYLELPVFKELSSTNIRKCIFEGDKKCFLKYYPKSINQNKIWKIVQQYL